MLPIVECLRGSWRQMALVTALFYVFTLLCLRVGLARVAAPAVEAVA
ncbi:hypothetical protein ITP53_50510 [Nonomuraea sp. K274]|uniref:Uncharacterized protein n=1 Tax=Nonomuraea cypriaca TaxID=1187855 RepID=A0A931AP06_9ACTN|nr:hypothetical protein [Nonomuraea cypriaca]MBF8193780.1 hypothetical protein [Nonomuraea cypriaca]